MTTRIQSHVRLFRQKPVTVRPYWREPYKMDLHRTRFQRFVLGVKRFFIRAFWLSGGVSAILLAGFIGSYFWPRTVMAEPIYNTPAVLQRIAQCESHSSHYCTDELVALHMCPKGMVGQVLVRGNTNKSVDVGKYQINADTWGAIATEQGFNIFTEQGNSDMAKWIYENRGTADWEASRKCWYK